jgi:hypothetical protein
VWSGVYYVDAGTELGGLITFARELEALEIAPRRGLMLMFPGDLLHSVSRYDGESARTCVGFNLFR